TDFANVSTPAITAIKDFFYTTVRDWFAKVTGFELDSYVALSASSYGYTDRLLCHDDELEERLIAFVLYLTPDWTERDGGSLDIFHTDGSVFFICEQHLILNSICFQKELKDKIIASQNSILGYDTVYEVTQ
ncbi:unnamed protein product, partial [Soboliphyme baturini]|uniref:2OG-FeII_Oxy_4 domain-containing protein n=1 Tax=Soboliphyme baturini TaxID=241478 RepID=A0A183J9P8_9BILA